MKKSKPIGELRYHSLKKILLIMRIAAILMILGILQTRASEAYSQKTNLSVNFSQTEILKVLDKIEDESEFFFLYNEKLLDTDRKVSISEKDQPINVILDDLFAGTDVKFSIIDRKIILAPEYLTKESNATSKSQQKKITGKVTNSSGDALPGVTVLVTGTTTGTLTDPDGNFSLVLPENAKTLTISFIGMNKQEVKIGTESVINVTMEEASIGLDEVLVVGYGTQKKRNVTGAIASINSENIVKSAQTSFTQSLEGKVPGLTAIQTTGQPGAGPNIKIRSNPSFASSGVLYILDGVPVNDNAGEAGSSLLYGSAGVNRTSLNFINPNDIESIQVLKDAAAASIYGARAGAGVILITTKRGISGKPKVDYSGSIAFQQPAEFYDILDTKDYMNERNHILYDMYLRNNNISPYGSADPSLAPPFIPKFTDSEISSTPEQESATKAITQNGYINQQNLSVSGGDEKTRYFISGNYLSQKGVLISSAYQRFNSRINLDQKISEKIKMGVNFASSNSNADNAQLGIESNENASMIKAAFYQPPNIPLIDENGNYPINPDYVNTPNPLSYREITDKTYNKRLLTSAYAEWTIISGLTAKANFSYDQSSSKRSVYFPKSFLKGYTTGGDASVQDNSNTSELAEFTLNYVVDLNSDNKLNFLAGYSYNYSEWEGLSARNYKFLTDQFLYNNLAAGEAPRPSVGSFKSNQTWASYFGRVIYELKSRYLLTATIRRDGSSIFAQDKKYGVFPSVSAGWIISNESFYQDNIFFMNFLKLRMSYGTTGNSNIGSNAFAYYSTGYNYVFNNTDNVGVYPSQLNNDNLTWETAKEFNVGIDFQMLAGRINGSFDYFNKTVSDLLSFRPLPTSFPVSSIADNVGKTRSTGWEIGLQTRNVVSSGSGFEWTTEFTLSHYYDSWVERSPASLKILEKYIDPQGPFNGVYGYQNAGMYTSDKTLPTWMPGILPGTIIIKDSNGYGSDGELTGNPDDQINTADMVQLGIADPKLSFGITSNMRYKNFDLSIYMYGVQAIKFNQDLATAFVVESQLAQFGWNAMVQVKDRWSYNNMTSKWPSGLSNAYVNYANNSDYWKENGTFLRVQDITLGYSLPSSIIQKQKVLAGLRATLSLQNMFVFTKYSGIDPELDSWVTYPNPKSIIFGLNASF